MSLAAGSNGHAKTQKARRHDGSARGWWSPSIRNSKQRVDGTERRARLKGHARGAHRTAARRADPPKTEAQQTPERCCRQSAQKCRQAERKEGPFRLASLLPWRVSAGPPRAAATKAVGEARQPVGSARRRWRQRR